MSAILQEAPTLEIAGKTYTLRRLGIRDVRAVAKILTRRLGEISSIGDDVGAAGVKLASIFLEELETLTPIVADIMGLKPEEFEDPNTVPLPDIARVAGALAEHPDITAFVKNVQDLAVSPAFRMGARRAEIPSPSN